MYQQKVEESELDYFFKGNDKCTYKIGDRVRMTKADAGVPYAVGTEATIKGNAQDDSIGELYLIHMDGDPETTLVVSLLTRFEKI